ncbi:PHP domain-containing protein [Microbacterium hydrocarbonoxydans]|uniref:PHP domain-containing protein n=1 Tax=Microbacterium hydrocarbonoxydans TaxID=273678 RepID=UPI000943BF78|nr:PHP domain-containing protein [Microbacterium hydrocarbonoxydans]
MAVAPSPRFAGPSDLHMHSNHSDGTQSPAEVVRQAHAHGVRTLALTDHDRTTGWDEAAEASAARGMTFIPGMELSAKHEWRSVTYWGTCSTPSMPTWSPRRTHPRRPYGRAERSCAASARLRPGSDDVLAQTTLDATVGRPHIADALIREDRPRSHGPRRHPASARGLRAALCAGPADRCASDHGRRGVPIIAHPVTPGVTG